MIESAPHKGDTSTAGRGEQVVVDEGAGVQPRTSRQVQRDAPSRASEEKRRGALRPEATAPPLHHSGQDLSQGLMWTQETFSS